ncbi:MAG: hypothetical protein U0935_18975 [Pirellulales bacterium]
MPPAIPKATSTAPRHQQDEPLLQFGQFRPDRPAEQDLRAGRTDQQDLAHVSATPPPSPLPRRARWC